MTPRDQEKVVHHRSKIGTLQMFEQVRNTRKSDACCTQYTARGDKRGRAVSGSQREGLPSMLTQTIPKPPLCFISCSMSDLISGHGSYIEYSN